MNMVNIMDVKEHAANFTKFANYSSDGSDSDYVPMIDPLGPYLFYPPHCFQPTGSKYFNSTVIALVLNDNSLEHDI